jgi:hypothetical protein
LPNIHRAAGVLYNLPVSWRGSSSRKSILGFYSGQFLARKGGVSSSRKIIASISHPGLAAARSPLRPFHRAAADDGDIRARADGITDDSQSPAGRCSPRLK